MKPQTDLKKSYRHQSNQTPGWTSESTVATDCTLHQIAPYIGRMKTSIARFLIESQTEPSDLIVDPFCGCGSIALEAALANRRVVAGDWNSYAVLLTRAKLFPPTSLSEAERSLKKTWKLSRALLRQQDLRRVPLWIRQFFHPETLRNALAFRDACIQSGNDFLLACLLGILHHQRPGFLSFPSSHLVPYLRDRKFPRDTFPTLYQERDVFVRLEAKLDRTYRRPAKPFLQRRRVVNTNARLFPRVRNIKAVITSPPYMNELDYVRDNRLRLWFIARALPEGLELLAHDREQAFAALLTDVFKRLAPNILRRGRIVLVVGDATRGHAQCGRTATLTRWVFRTEAAFSEFRLESTYHDTIPDIRRSRHECSGTKTETTLIYRKM